MSVQTKEVSSALSSLLKAKGQRSSQSIAVAKPAVTAVEVPKTTVTQTPETPATPVAPVVTPTVTDPYEDRYKNLKAHHDKTIYEERLRSRQLEEDLARATAPKVELPKTEAELVAFKEKHPEAFDIMTTVALKAVSQTNAEVRATLDEAKKLENAAREKESLKELLREHPDALEIRESAKFAEWFNEQPEDIKNILANSNNVKSVSKQLTLYKLEVLGINPKGKKKEEAEERLTASMGVPLTGRTEIASAKKVWTKSEVDAVCANYNTWNQHREEIDLARREGRFDPTK